MTAPLRSHTSVPRKRKSESDHDFTQSNLTKVFQRLYDLMPKTQVEIAEAVGISQSAVSGWLAGSRNVRFEHIPKLAALFGVNDTTFLKPVEEFDKERRGLDAKLAGLDAQRDKIIREFIANMERYTNRPVQVHLFEPGAASASQAGRHLQSVT